MMHATPIATYRTPRHLVWTTAIAGAFVAVPMLFAVLTSQAETPGRELVQWILIAIGIGLLLLAYTASKVRTLIFEDRVEKMGAFSHSILHARDIAGFRKATPEGYIRLFPDRPPAESMRVPGELRKHFELTWIDKLIDLDAADLRAIDRAVMESPQLGATAGERSLFVQKIKRHIGWLTAAGFAAAAWAFFWPEPRNAVFAVLIALPLISLAVAARARPAIRVVADRGALDLLLALWVPSSALVLMAETGAHLVERPPLMFAMVSAAIAGAFLYWLDPLVRRKWLSLAMGAGILGFGARGAAIEANTLLDRAAPERIEAKVYDKEKRTRKNTSPGLILEPLAPGEEPAHIDVPRTLYDTASIGGRICLTIHPGALGWRWYEVEGCRPLILPP